MGLLTRAFVPRSVRRAAHPVRTAKSAVTPRVVKQARNVMNPVDSAVYYGIERPLNTKPRKRTAKQQAQVPAVESTPQTPKQKRAGRIGLAVVIAVYVVLSLIFGWITVFATTLLAAFVAWKLLTLK
jgi:hypothetical protein